MSFLLLKGYVEILIILVSIYINNFPTLCQSVALIVLFLASGLMLFESQSYICTLNVCGEGIVRRRDSQEGIRTLFKIIVATATSGTD